jgi:hypothetical protein
MQMQSIVPGNPSGWRQQFSTGDSSPIITVALIGVNINSFRLLNCLINI